MVFPPPARMPSTRNVVAVEVDPGVAFAVQLRQSRLRSRLTQKEAARRTWSAQHLQLQRLERRANPSLAIIKKGTTLFLELSLDSVLGGT